jgi:MoxR-like ATPase
MTTRTDATPLSDAEMTATAASLGRLSDALNNVLFGQEALIEMVMIGLLARGHLLLEGLPGLGKTELVKGLAKALQLEMKRVQFTPDLLPGDITGNPVLQEIEGTRTFVFRPGPLFANLVLADEINRASPKTQSALLEAMQERQVTVMGTAHMLPDPFFVLATQNPIELEGTYPLPEAQLDRFLLKIEVKRSAVETLEKIVLNRKIGGEPHVPAVLNRDELVRLLDFTQRIYLPPVVANYIARLVEGTHTLGKLGIKYGASPRAALALAACARARALLHGRSNASTEDVRAVAPPILQHRIILDYNARLDGASTATVVEKLLGEIPAHDLERPKTLLDAKLR